MCGFAGIVRDQGLVDADRDALARATRALRHRGPDDEGLCIEAQVGLGHRRLSIIDLDAGAQPFESACGRYVMAFNGEIYNYLELGAELAADGYQARTRTDTEVLAQTWARQGVDGLGRCNGMFAAAIWDRAEHSLTLLRDRVGKKPLYYAPMRGGIAFASEIQVLPLFDGFDDAIDPDAVHDFFAHQYIGGERSIYRGARKLLPGHVLHYRDGAVRTQCYWQPPRPQAQAADGEALCAELRELFADAVRLRLRSDVPVGVFLSGGIDSCLVADEVHARSDAIEAFTIGFEESSYDETPTAAAVAGQLGLRHHVATAALYPAEMLEQSVRTWGEPFADPSALPTASLCRFTREHVTVALSGDGVDELFGGYQRYRARLLAERIRFLPVGLRDRVLDLGVRCLSESDAYYGADRGKQLRLFRDFVRQLDASPGDPGSRLFSDRELASLLPDVKADASAYDFVGRYSLETLAGVDQMMQTDLRNYLAENILTKVDRASMRHGLEVRSPFLDYRIVEFAARLPAAHKLDSREQKRILRRCFAARLPEFVRRRRKHGFAVPLGKWFREGLRESFQAQVLDAPDDTLLDRRTVADIWDGHQRGERDYGHQLWAILVFRLWLAQRGGPVH